MTYTERHCSKWNKKATFIFYTAISQPNGHTVKWGATDFSQQMKEHLLDALYK